MERSDSVSVLWTYRGFRAANPAIDTREGVNATDYPKSASKYGLGRAYKAAGDAQNARGSFRKALEIDPSFKKASDGLNAVR